MAAASIIASVITGGSNSHQMVAEELNAYATDFVNQGVVGAITLGAGSTAGTGAFAVTQDASPDMGVTVLLGNVYVSGTPSGQDAQVIRARMTSNYTGYTISANASGSTKYDWIYLQLSAANANNPSSAADNVITLFTSRSSSNASDNGSPPTYGVLLAVVTVANGASSITNSNISDRRTQSSLSSVNSGSSTGWNSLGYALTYSANNGSLSFAVTTPNNLTGLLSLGMRMSVARSTTPPTQAMAFASASSQYATKASPSGITFTGAFACEAWIYLLSNTGSTQSIINRSDQGTSGGWSLEINSSGQLRLVYGSGSTFTDFISNTTIPLNQWVHVAGVATSVSGKTGALYMNGTLLGSTSALTASTTLAQQSVDLRVGARSGTATNYFNGYMSEVRVWSATQTQANIQANMTANLTGSESNLAGLWEGNGVFTDATSNANNLTATNGAIATQAANPFNATEYAIITGISYSNPTTTITLQTPAGYTIPNQTLNSPYYSTVKDPFGFPLDLTKWTLTATGVAQRTTTSTNFVTFTDALLIPIGAWLIRWSGTLTCSPASDPASARITIVSLSDTALSSTSVTYQNLTAQVWCKIGATTTNPVAGAGVLCEMAQTIAAAATYTMYGRASAGSPTTTSNLEGAQRTTVIEAVCTYL